jgi:signal transduction histidine kinase
MPVLKTLKSRVLLVLVASLAVSHIAGLWLYARKHEEAASLLQDTLLADRIALTAQLLERAAPADRAVLVARLNSPLMKVSLQAAPTEPSPIIEGTRPHQFEHLVGLLLDRPDHNALWTNYRPAANGDGKTSLLATLSAAANTAPHHLPFSVLDDIHEVGQVTTVVGLADGARVTFLTPLLHVSPFSPLNLWAPLLAMLLSVMVSGAWVLSRATQPLMSLAQAAERLGADINAAPLPVNGALEVRSAAQAFNIMQERIQQLVEDRTAFSAAMAHDIGTPVTRLLLRLEDMADGDLKSRIESDIGQMQRMIRATLGFARTDFQSEPSERFDVVAMVQSIADDISGAAMTVGLAHLTIMSKPVAVHRAVANITENAVKYGKRATITVAISTTMANSFTITVDDAGPGIPAHLHEDAFKPFRRFAESTDIEGTGLGLSVARSVARSLGGAVTLENQPTGGLRVRVSLPMRS